MGKKKITSKEIKQREAALEIEQLEIEQLEIEQLEMELVVQADVQNLIDLEDRRPKIVRIARALIAKGKTPESIAHTFFRENRHMWVESRFLLSATRAIKIENDNE